MKRLSGFSLMEMMVVLLITAVVAAVTAPMISKKMVSSAGGDSPWMWAGLQHSIVYNVEGNANKTANIGGIAPTDNPFNKNYDWGPRLYIETSGKNVPHITFKSQAAPNTNTDRFLHLIYNNGAIFLSSLIPDKNDLKTKLGFSTVIGVNSEATGDGATVIGASDDKATPVTAAKFGTAIGSSSNAAENGTAIGAGSKAGPNATALGASANASSNNSLAIGYNSQAMKDGCVAIVTGNSGGAKGDYSTAYGYQAHAAGNYSVAVGSKAHANNYAVSIGGSNSNVITKAANNSVAIGYEAVAMSSTTNISGATVIGNGAQATGTNSTAIGRGTGASGSNSIAIGRGSQATQTNAIAIGSGGTTATSANSIAIGLNAKSTNTESIAIGKDVSATVPYSTAIGYNATASGAYSTAIGHNASTSNANEIVLGNANTTVYIPGKIKAENVELNGNIYLWGRQLLWRIVGVTSISVLGIPSQGVTDVEVLLLSDKKLKNIGDAFKGGLAEIRKLEVFNYTFKKDQNKTPMVGVIAQDLQKIFPNAVFKGDDGFLRIRLDEIFYAMVNAIKELDIRVTNHDKKIEALEKQNLELQKKLDKLEQRLNKLEKKSK